MSPKKGLAQGHLHGPFHAEGVPEAEQAAAAWPQGNGGMFGNKEQGARICCIITQHLL